MRLLKKKNKWGFTLGELLIVVGIIGVLSSIAIPILVRSLESAREAYDIYTMRQAASAAIDLYYAGITDSNSASKAGLLWNKSDKEGTNAYGVYDPGSGTFLPLRSKETEGISYGKGTKINGGKQLTMGNKNGAYANKEDYTKAVVMIAIYPLAANPHVDIYWKGYDQKYIGGQNKANDPKYSIRIALA